MNKRSPIIASLDIGTSKICAVVARKNPVGKIEVLGIGMADSTGVVRGVISNIDKTVDAINKAIAEASRRSGIAITNVYVGITGLTINCHRRKGYILRHSIEEEIGAADVERLMDDMHRMTVTDGEEIIHVLPQEYTVDTLPPVKDPIGMSGIRLDGDFYVITGQKNSLRTIHRCLEKAGLNVAGICLEPIASAASVLSAEEKEAGVALVDIGGGTTDLAVYKEGIIRHVAVIPFGGDIVTRDIKEGCNVMAEQAEKLKVKFGAALASEAKENAIVSISGYLRGREAKEISLKNLSYIIQARMEEILEYVYYELKESGYEHKLIGGIVLTGGGARLQYIQHLTQFITGLDVRVGLPIDYLANGKRELSDPIYATGLGLAIRALNEEEPAETREIEMPTILEEQQQETAETREEQNQDYLAQNNLSNEPRFDDERDYEDGELAVEGEEKGWINSTLQKWRNWLERDVKDFD